MVRETGLTLSPEIEKVTIAWAYQEKTILYVVAEGRLLGAFARKMRFGLSPVKRSQNSISLASGSQ